MIMRERGRVCEIERVNVCVSDKEKEGVCVGEHEVIMQSLCIKQEN